MPSMILNCQLSVNISISIPRETEKKLETHRLGDAGNKKSASRCFSNKAAQPNSSQKKDDIPKSHLGYMYISHFIHHCVLSRKKSLSLAGLFSMNCLLYLEIIYPLNLKICSQTWEPGCSEPICNQPWFMIWASYYPKAAMVKKLLCHRHHLHSVVSTWLEATVKTSINMRAKQECGM